MLHKAPSHPSMHIHWKALTLSTHVPPFSHGFTLQSLISAKEKTTTMKKILYDIPNLGEDIIFTSRFMVGTII